MATQLRTYPHGVPSWIDVVQPDLDAGQEFYGELFGWTFTRWAHHTDYVYLLAHLDGEVAAGLTSRPGEAAWRTYVSVEDLEAVSNAAVHAGGRLVVPINTAEDEGRWAAIADPSGAELGLWEAQSTYGVQVLNAPGSWTFTAHLSSAPSEAIDWYALLFGWVEEPGEGITLLRVPGFGQHLADTCDPDIFERLDFASEGFPDAVALAGTTVAPPHWLTIFSVDDRDAAIARAERLGATVLAYHDYAWSHNAIIRDPQGAVLGLSEFAPPAGIDARL